MRSSLIVTPDKELANLIRTSLSDNDRVDMIDNLDGALAVFKKNPFDVIFADLSILKDGIPDLNLTESILSF